MMKFSVVLASLALASAVPECVRPVHFHWLNKESPTNASTSLFTNNPSTLLNLYTSFETSLHVTNDGRDLRFFCNGYHFVMESKQDPTRKHEDAVFGLGHHSQIWNHYKTAAFTPKTIAFGRSKEKHFDGNADKWQKWDCNGENTNALCNLEPSPAGKIKHKDVEIGSFTGVRLFSNSEDVEVPQEVYGYVHHNNVDELTFDFGERGTIVCGEGCLYSSNVWEQRKYHIKIRNDGYVWLNQRYQINQDIFYDAQNQTIYIKPIQDVISLDTFYSQILLISKFVLVCFLATYRKRAPLWGRITVALMMAAIATEQSWYIAHLDVSPRIPMFIIWCAWLVIFYINLLFPNMLYPNSNVGIVLVIQSTFTELDSYELVFIGYTMFAVITTNEIVSTTANIVQCLSKDTDKFCMQDLIDLALSASYVVALAAYHTFVDNLTIELQSLFGNQYVGFYGAAYWSLVLIISVEWVIKAAETTRTKD